MTSGYAPMASKEVGAIPLNFSFKRKVNKFLLGMGSFFLGVSGDSFWMGGGTLASNNNSSKKLCELHCKGDPYRFQLDRTFGSDGDGHLRQTYIS